MSEVVVIGAGASGLACAICAARRKNKVTILERNSYVCKKILITGNGRCNYFNTDQSINHYHSSSNNIDKIITKSNLDEVLSFFDSIGIVPRIKNGYYYPYSNQAVSMKEALLTEAKLLNINIVTDYLVNKIEKVNKKFIINDEIECDNLILSTGSKAYPKTGSDGMGYDFAKKFGHTIIKPLPALVQLKSNEKYLKYLKGIRCDAKVSLYIDNKLLKEETGELQFTDYGISGICVFNLSYLVSRNIDDNKKIYVTINFLPFLNKTCDFIRYMDNRNEKIKSRTVREIFDGILNYNLVNVLLKKLNINANKYYNELSKIEKEKLAKSIIEFNLEITGTNSFDKSQVCTGGVSLSEINIETMESLKEKNLYLTGELLDVDATCGGYNLTFAFISGLIAGCNIK